MKKLRLITAFCIVFGMSLSCMYANTEQIPTIKSKILERKIVDNRGVLSFSVESDISRYVDFSFLTLPAYFPDSTFSEYSIMVNGKLLDEKINFSSKNWQYASTKTKSALLKAGDNVIEFLVTKGNLPIIKDLQIYDTETF